MNPVALTDFAGVLFWPRSRVAMVREEWEGRLEVLSSEGELAHRPGPLSALEGWPFVSLAPGVLVNPEFARPEGDRVRLPGGWVVPGRLPEAGPGPAPAVDDPLVEDAGVRASEVLYVEARPGDESWWVTAGGRVAGRPGLSGRRRAALHPNLRAAGWYWFANPLRLRFLRRVYKRFAYRVGFDEGTVVERSPRSAGLLARSLGLGDPEWVGGETEGQRGLRRLGIRRWPVRLATAPPALLAREFAGEPAVLVANLALETVEAVRRGDPVFDGDTHRGWYYRVARLALERAGHLAVETLGMGEGSSWEGRWRVLEAAAVLESLRAGARGWRRRELTHPTFGARLPLDGEGAWSLTCKVLTHLVFVLRLFTYQEMGFRDGKPELRLLGTRRPEVVVVVEKESLLERARLLLEEFGVTVYVTGGLPPVIGAEFLAQDLRDRGVAEVRLVSYCDFDVVGWEMPDTVAAQLERYGMPVAGVRRLVTPDRFTAEELERLSVPQDTSRQHRYLGRLRKFMEESGGIGGEPRGMLADFLPEERVVEGFKVAAGEWL